MLIFKIISRVYNVYQKYTFGAYLVKVGSVVQMLELTTELHAYRGFLKTTFLNSG